MNTKHLLLLVVIFASPSVWMVLGIQRLINTPNGEVDTKEENIAVSVLRITLIFFPFSFIIWPVMAYLEMQLLSFLFEKFKSRMTIDDEDDQYRPLQQIDLSEMEDLV